MRKILLLSFFLGINSGYVFAQYPFTLPSDITAEISIDTSSKEKFNNLLLGYNIFNFSSKTEKI